MTCLVPNCPACAYLRGRCLRHYRQARNAITAGKVTWEQLEREGTALAASDQRANIHRFMRRQTA